MKSSTKGLITVVVVLAIFSIVGLFFLFSNTATEISLDQFKQKIDGGTIREISIENDIVTAKDISSSTKYKVYVQQSNTSWVYVEVDEVTGEVTEKYFDDLFAYVSYYNALNPDATIKISQNDRNEGSIWASIIPIVGAVALIVFAIFIFRSMGGANKQAMNFGKSRASVQGGIKVRFSDVAGAEEEKEELKEIVEFLKSPQKFTAVGAKIPRGVLLVGPPGTGKTLFAKAVAGEANVPFFSISGSDFVEMYVGVGASRVRDLFENAKRNMPCIIFIDEIDAVGRQRGAGLGGGHDEREQTLNQLLVQMDGFATNDGIIVMAATNRADILDPALLRPGRFDRQVYVDVPDVRGREAIFKVHARNKPLAADVDFQVLARITSGFSGADISNVLNEAAILCARDNRKKITMDDINEAISKVSMGPEKKSRLVTEEDKRITAYHEAGHAIVTKALKTSDTVHAVTIIPRGQAGGYTQYRPERDRTHRALSEYQADIASAMGGRAAEKIVIHDVTQGAVGDIQQATKIAKYMVTRFGMSELGPVCYGDSQEIFVGRGYQQTVDYSEQTAAKIDAEVSRLINEGYEKAIAILTENRDKLDTMARVLIECETIGTEEVDMIMAGATPSEVKDALEKRLSEKYERKKNSANEN